MILMSKYDIYTMFRNLYAKHGIVLADKAFHLDIHADQLPEDLALNVRKSALIFNLLCGAPELWTGDGETDVFLMCGWDTYYLTTLMPHKVAYFHKLKTERQQIATAAGLHYNDVMLMPIAYYLNLANSVAYQNIYRSQFTEHVGSAIQQTAEDLYARILVALQNTANTAARMKVEHGRSFALGSLVQTCANLKIELEKPNHARSTGDLILEVGSDGLKALYCFWNCIRAPYMPFEDLCFLIGIKRDTVKVNIFDKLGVLGATIGAIYETVKLDGAPLSYEPPKCEQDEGNPFTDRVAQWLADLLRPKTIHWLTRDPIADVLSSAAKETACQHPTIDAKQLAGDLYELHFQNKLSGAVPPLRINLERLAARDSGRAPLTAIDDLRNSLADGGFVVTQADPALNDDNIVRGFAPELTTKLNKDGYAEINVTVGGLAIGNRDGFIAAFRRLCDAKSAGSVSFAAALKNLFDEKVRLSPVPIDARIDPRALVYFNDSRTRKYVVLWASTGKRVLSVPSHCDVIDLGNLGNVAHLYNRYVKLHSQPSETMPCSHFTSRPT